MPVETIRWHNGKLSIIDQTRLPTEFIRIDLASAESVWEAIRSLRVRGAPAIGVCAAFGILVGLNERRDDEHWLDAVVRLTKYFATARPTAVNLFWALDRMRRCADSLSPTLLADDAHRRLEAEAQAIFDEDQALCLAIGRHGAQLIEEGAGVLTHCNAGALATSGSGTALAAMYAAAEQGTHFAVYADETRPLLQGSRLTAWELSQVGIPVTVICDNAAAQVMRENRVQLVMVGADRIAANGDVANKIGTYGVALLAKAHALPFYVAAPTSTFDLNAANGNSIPIEQRDPEEVAKPFGRQSAPAGVEIYNPAFDVTPAELITGIVTEHGILRPPYSESIASMFSRRHRAASVAGS